MDNTTPVREEIPFHFVVGAVYSSNLLVWIAIYEIWPYNKLIMV
jgi:hypothetical protein